mmetsp:Transcript_110942/g.227061  ORF Transcript_110942/g.227061 Transcript_110942/m.227061 type:complete len:646 (+) Transcript_110942:696-2633(+)
MPLILLLVVTFLSFFVNSVDYVGWIPLSSARLGLATRCARCLPCIAPESFFSFLQLRTHAFLHAVDPAADVFVGVVSDVGLIEGIVHLAGKLPHELGFHLGLLVSEALLAEETLGVQGRGGTASRGCDGLAVDGVRDVPGGVDSWNGCLGALPDGLDVSGVAFVEFHDALQKAGVGGVADGHEHRVALEGAFLAGDDVLQDSSRNHHVPRCGRRIVQVEFVALVLAGAGIGIECFSFDLFQDRVPPDLDQGVVLDPVGEDLAGPEAVPPVDQSDLLRGSGQDQGVLHGGVPPANHDDVPAGKQKAVAGGTRRNTATPQLEFPGDTEPLAVGSGGHDDGMGVDKARRVGKDLHGTRGSVDFGHQVFFEHGSELNRLGPHGSNDGRSSEIVQTGIVLHVDALALQLSSHARSNDQRGETGTGGVNRRCHAGRSATDHDDLFREGSGNPSAGFVFQAVFFFAVLLLDLLVAFVVLSFFQFREQLFLGSQVEVRNGVVGFCLRFAAATAAAAGWRLLRLSLVVVCRRGRRRRFLVGRLRLGFGDEQLGGVGLFFVLFLQLVRQGVGDRSLAEFLFRPLAFVVNRFDVRFGLARIDLAVKGYQVVELDLDVFLLGLPDGLIGELSERAFSDSSLLFLDFSATEIPLKGGQ